MFLFVCLSFLRAGIRLVIRIYYDRKRSAIAEEKKHAVKISLQRRNNNDNKTAVVFFNANRLEPKGEIRASVFRSIFE